MARRKSKSQAVKSSAPQVVQAKFDLAQTTSENRKHWASADGLSARAAISPAVRRVVRIRSRYEAENNSWYAGILRTAVNHIIGNGPRLQMLTGNPDADKRVEKAFRQWAQRIDLADMLRTITEAYWRDGETFVMRSERPRNYPLTLDLRILESDQISNPWVASTYNDPFIDDGIRFDRDTNEIDVYVYDHHPGSNVPVSTLTGNWYSVARSSAPYSVLIALGKPEAYHEPRQHFRRCRSCDGRNWPRFTVQRLPRTSRCS
jgi:capsid protein